MTIAEPPARALPDGVVADLGFDLGIAHPRVIVPRGVVGAHVLEAEPVIIVQIEPGFRRAEVTGPDAAGVVARPHRRAGRSLENRVGQKAPHRN